MAQRKSTPTGKNAAGKPASAKSGGTAGKRPGGANPSSGKAPAGRTTITKQPSGRPAAPRKPGKSIVNQKQRPWGLIASAVAVVLFAAAVIIVVVATHKSDTKTAAATNTSGCTQMIGNNPTSYLNESKCAAAIKGVTFTKEANRNHVQGHITYDTSPPVGGNHSQYWADCTGTVYPNAIANENAVHMLEHGAVWVTYNPDTLSTSGLDRLKKYVSGNDRMALSPYPNLKTPISLQSWGYQLFLNSPTDPRIARFISALRYNQKTTPEYGATCSQPTFKAHPSTFGNPLWQPAGG